jgi:hypothetical protein
VAPQRSTVRETVEATIRNGQEFLRGAQLPNGSWANSPWETGFCIISLVESGVPSDDPMFAAATDWLMTQSRREGQAGTSWESFTWDTSLVIRALRRTARAETDQVVGEAVRWTLKTEIADLDSSRQLFHYGYCYPAQTLIMLSEEGGLADERRQISTFLRQSQEPDGGWITDFDTAQIVEALARDGVAFDSEWEVNHGANTYPGGLPKVVDWIERRQTPGGGWSGLTLPAALMFRAYILTNAHPDRDVVGLALTWFLHQICDDGSCFHEPARTGAMIETMTLLLKLADEPRGAHLGFHATFNSFLASMDDTVAERAAARRAQLTDLMSLRQQAVALANISEGRRLRLIRLFWFFAALSLVQVTAAVAIGLANQRADPLSVVLAVNGLLQTLVPAAIFVVRRLTRKDRVS